MNIFYVVQDTVPSFSQHGLIAITCCTTPPKIVGKPMFHTHTTSTNILVPLRKTLLIVVGFNETQKVLSSVNNNDQKIKNFDCSDGLKLEG